MFDINEIWKGVDLNALAKIPEELEGELASIPVRGESAGGLVVVEGSCDGQVSKVSIDASLLPDEKERRVLTDLLVAALNVMLNKIRKKNDEFKMGKLVSLMNDTVKKSMEEKEGDA